MLLYFLVAHRRRCRIGFEPVFRTTCGFYECEKQLLQLADAVLVGNHPAVGMRYIGDIEIEDHHARLYLFIKSCEELDAQILRRGIGRAHFGSVNLSFDGLSEVAILDERIEIPLNLHLRFYHLAIRLDR